MPVALKDRKAINPPGICRAASPRDEAPDMLPGGRIESDTRFASFSAGLRESF
jgi:hypothetical protein